MQLLPVQLITAQATSILGKARTILCKQSYLGMSLHGTVAQRPGSIMH